MFNYRRFLTTTSGSTSLSISNQQSGGILDDMYLALVDEFGQIVSSDSSSTATISVTSDNSESQTYTPTLTGATTITATNGVFKFTGLTFTAEPGENYGKRSYKV